MSKNNNNRQMNGQNGNVNGAPTVNDLLGAPVKNETVSNNAVETVEENKETDVEVTSPTTPIENKEEEKVAKDEDTNVEHLKADFMNPPEEVKKEEVVTPVQPTTPVVDAGQNAEAKIIIGSSVKIKEECKKMVTGASLPPYAYKNIYKVKNVLPTRLVLVAGTYTVAVTKEDVYLV